MVSGFQVKGKGMLRVGLSEFTGIPEYGWSGFAWQAAFSERPGFSRISLHGL